MGSLQHAFCFHYGRLSWVNKPRCYLLPEHSAADFLHDPRVQRRCTRVQVGWRIVTTVTITLQIIHTEEVKLSRWRLQIICYENLELPSCAIGGTVGDDYKRYCIQVLYLVTNKLVQFTWPFARFHLPYRCNSSCCFDRNTYYSKHFKNTHNQPAPSCFPASGPALTPETLPWWNDLQ